MEKMAKIHYVCSRLSENLFGKSLGNPLCICHMIELLLVNKGLEIISCMDNWLLHLFNYVYITSVSMPVYSQAHPMMLLASI